MADETTKSMWAIISLMGHKKIAGFVEEDTLAGHGVLKVTVPQTSTDAPFTTYIEPKALYCLDPVTEDIARAHAEINKHRPIEAYDNSAILIQQLKQAPAKKILEYRPDLTEDCVDLEPEENTKSLIEKTEDFHE